MREFEERMDRYIKEINSGEIEEDLAFVYVDRHMVRVKDKKSGKVRLSTFCLEIEITKEGEKRVLYAGVEISKRVCEDIRDVDREET